MLIAISPCNAGFQYIIKPKMEAGVELPWRKNNNTVRQRLLTQSCCACRET
jgi:hypothetical protein